jgi:putative Mg2+ transporter-C (MgtC) family protein
VISDLELIGRIAAGAVLGGVIGFERDRHRRPVGLRTHLIVAMAAATFMVLSSQLVYHQGYGKDDLVEVDASRIAASVVSGIGFLAGGAILRTGVTVQGLTTAAGLWLVTAIGMCAGAGMFPESVAVTAMGITALTVLRRLEDKNDSLLRCRVSVSLEASADGTNAVLTALATLHAAADEIEYERNLDGDKTVQLVLDVQYPAVLGMGRLVAALEMVPGVHRVRVQHHV